MCQDFEKLLHLLVRCKVCNNYLFAIFDPSIRDTCDSCGGSGKAEYSLKGTDT